MLSTLPLPHLATATPDPATLETLAGVLCGNIDAQNIPVGQWAALLKLADEHKLLMPAYQVYREAFPLQPIDPALARLEFSHQAYTLHLQLIVSGISRIFATSDLPVVWLKGVILAHTIYAQPWLRYMRDLDLLVPYERRHEALHLLKQMGFIHTKNGLGSEYEKFHADYQLSYQNEDHLIVAELHYKPLTYVSKPLFVDDDRWFWEHTRTIKTPMGELTTFTNEVFFLQLVLHDVFHHEQRFPDTQQKEPPQLRRKYDLYVLLKQVKLDFDAIFEGAKMLDCLYAVVCAFEDLQHYFGMDFADEIARYKADRQYPVQFNFHERDAYIKLKLLIGTIRDMSPREYLAFVRRIFIGSPESLRTTLHIDETQPVYPHHYIYRTLKRMIGFIVVLPTLAIKSLRRGTNKRTTP